MAKAPVVQGFERNSEEYKLYLEDCYGRHCATLQRNESEIQDLKAEIRKIRSSTAPAVEEDLPEEFESELNSSPALKCLYSIVTDMEKKLSQLHVSHVGTSVLQGDISSQPCGPDGGALSHQNSTSQAPQGATSAVSSATALSQNHQSAALRNIISSQGNGKLFPSYYIALRKKIEHSKFVSTNMTLAELAYG